MLAIGALPSHASEVAICLRKRSQSNTWLHDQCTEHILVVHLEQAHLAGYGCFASAQRKAGLSEELSPRLLVPT